MIRTSAPGRVNLIGEHTDYNGGFVLPTPIPQRARVQLRQLGGDRVVVSSREFGAQAGYRIGEEQRRGAWLDYVMGCTAILREAGHRIGGSELQIASDVPIGRGLSSSAALEIAVLRALREDFGLAIDDIQLALLGQRVEVEFVGAPVGAMDQLVASHSSLRDDFEASLPAIDRLVAIARADSVIYGARLTGGGFGGAIVALAVRGKGPAAASRIAARYQVETSLTPQVLLAGSTAGGDECSRS